jgi:hypothetical protein
MKMVQCAMGTGEIFGVAGDIAGSFCGVKSVSWPGTLYS